MYLARIPLEGGGWILVEAPAAPDGPVRAGRIGDAIHDLPTSLHNALEPVAEVARAAVDQLRRASPAGIELEFGVDLSVEAGAVITKTAATCHLKVTVTWRRGESDQDEPSKSSG